MRMSSIPVSRSVYLSRTFIHQTIALTADRIDEDPNPFYLQSSIPRRRLELTFGKISATDFFDVNEVGSDTHLQFTNIAIDNNGIYEYPGDVHGFTLAAMVNYQGPKIGVRFAEALLPKIDSGTDLDYDIRHDHSDNFEFDYSTYTFQGYGSHVRALAFLNHADLGNYRQATTPIWMERTKRPTSPLTVIQAPPSPASALTSNRTSPPISALFSVLAGTMEVTNRSPTAK